MLTIAMLLSNFMSLLANDKYDTSLRGIEWKSDTIKVAIPIELLRKANIKMIERKYFKNEKSGKLEKELCAGD